MKLKKPSLLPVILRMWSFKNQLEAANFWETALAGIDFSTDQFERMEVTPQLAKNMKISLSQAPFFTSLFGIEII